MLVKEEWPELGVLPLSPTAARQAKLRSIRDDRERSQCFQSGCQLIRELWPSQREFPEIVKLPRENINDSLTISS